LPSSTLFPYTTLFRSWGFKVSAGGSPLFLTTESRNVDDPGDEFVGTGQLCLLFRRALALLRGNASADHVCTITRPRQRPAGAAQDRKSTRLNSSHVKI